MAALIAADRPDHVIYLGDVYETGTRDEFETNFAQVYGDLAERMWPTPGNHDWPSHGAGYDPFWQATLGRELPQHYARKAGGWQVLSANSETPDDSQQLAWLRERVSGGGDCRIVFWHRPRLNAGFVHRSDQDDVKALWDAIEGRAAIALAGHGHAALQGDRRDHRVHQRRRRREPVPHQHERPQARLLRRQVLRRAPDGAAAQPRGLALRSPLTARSSTAAGSPARTDIGALRRYARSVLVGVAQLVELRVVVPAAAGSSPVAHPLSPCKWRSSV